jgi:hypothetical protein
MTTATSKETHGTWGWNTCIECTKLWVPSPEVQKKKNQKNERNIQAKPRQDTEAENNMSHGVGTWYVY